MFPDKPRWNWTFMRWASVCDSARPFRRVGEHRTLIFHLIDHPFVEPRLSPKCIFRFSSRWRLPLEIIHCLVHSSVAFGCTEGQGWCQIIIIIFLSQPPTGSEVWIGLTANKTKLEIYSSVTLCGTGCFILAQQANTLFLYNLHFHLLPQSSETISSLGIELASFSNLLLVAAFR